ncbi:hypothetical protein H6F51_10255 [Cyanobacteria bacterium FACHB-DQ100]|nr:hypothetical protein [Cyanobacteria bacterium FACHB-DQ100]
MGDTIAQYLGDTPSPNLADRVRELERIVSDLFARVAGANKTAVQSIAKSEILTEAELCDRFNIPHNWRSSVHGWNAEHWLSRKTGAVHLGGDRYRLNTTTKP